MSAAKRRSGLLTAGAVLWRSFDYLLLTHSGCILAFRAPALILCKMGIPFIPPRKDDMPSIWKNWGIRWRELITRKHSRKWMRSSAATRLAGTTSAGCAGRTDLSALIAAWAGSLGQWRKDGCAAGPAVAKHR